MRFCVSHPSRFGKSCVAEMLAVYYGRDCDSRSIFKNLDIAKEPSFEKHLNVHDVIFFTVTDVLHSDDIVKKGIEYLKAQLVYELGNELGIDFSEKELIPMLEEYHEKTHKGFVFIIDEWDCIFREESDNREGQELYIQFLKDLLADRDYVEHSYNFMNFLF